MQSLKQNKILLTVFILSTIAFLFYHFFGASEDIVTFDPILVGDEVVNDQTSAQILLLLNQMQQASINSQIFTSTAWKSLIDQSIVLPTDIPGRPDLFSGPLRSQGVTTTPVR